MQLEQLDKIMEEAEQDLSKDSELYYTEMAELEALDRSIKPIADKKYYTIKQDSRMLAVVIGKFWVHHYHHKVLISGKIDKFIEQLEKYKVEYDRDIVQIPNTASLLITTL